MRRSILPIAVNPRVTGAFCVLLAALALVFLAGQSTTASRQKGGAQMPESAEDKHIVLPETGDLTYLMQVDNPNACLSIPSLSLNTEEHTFQLFLSPLSSYLIFGTYKVEDNLLTAVTLDQSYCYRFRFEDETTLIYESGPSASTVGVPDESLAPRPKYGCRFCLSVSADQEPASELPDAAAGSRATVGNEAVYDLEQAVGLAVLSFHHGYYQQAECVAEGHLILDEETGSDGETTVYALTMYGEYQFQDNALIKASGSGAIPTVIHFSFSEENGYILRSCEVPADGGGYVESVHELFPEHLWDACITPDDEACALLSEQEQSYAKRYLQQLGREAEVGSYRDYPHTLLTDVGVSEEVSNLMCEYEKYEELWKYPYWIGNIEYVENGVRYVYAMSFDRTDCEIVYTKSEYDSQAIVETHVFDSLTGKKKR